MDNLLSHLNLPSPIEQVFHPILSDKNISLWIKREDLIHPYVSGNKWRKLKYNIQFAIQKNLTPIITFGGAYSNHLYAVAGACNLLGIPCIGIVRGELNFDNQTLRFCIEKGMKLVAQSRSDYRLKEKSLLHSELMAQYPNAYTIPEGGTNELALTGVGEIWPEIQAQIGFIPDYITTSCGTGGTAAGLALTCNIDTEILAFSALKTDYLENEIRTMIDNRKSTYFEVITDYHYGGYAKYNQELLDKIENLENSWNIPLDHVYNGKALLGLMDMIEQGKIKPDSKIIHIHTGGIQGKIKS